MASTNSRPARQTHNEHYYLLGGDVYFLVDNQIFRLHRYFFDRESEHFKHKLTLPASPGYPAPGSSEGNAIMLTDVNVAEFEAFLWVFYNPKYNLYDTTVAEWSWILKLSHRWGFPEVKSLAVRELAKLDMSGIDRIVLYEACHVDRSLLMPHYEELAARSNPLSVEEGERLGMRTSIQIATVRELVRSSPSNGSSSPLPSSIEKSDVHDRVREVMMIGGVTPPNSTRVLKRTTGPAITSRAGPTATIDVQGSDGSYASWRTAHVHEPSQHSQRTDTTDNSQGRRSTQGSIKRLFTNGFGSRKR